MLLQSLIPNLPTSLTELFVYVVAYLGAILLVYGLFLEIERRQDLVFALGSAGLFVYALYINNLIFMIAMGGLFLASVIEFTEIIFGLHKHNPEDLKRYKKLK
jgi:hypothetical protein